MFTRTNLLRDCTWDRGNFACRDREHRCAQLSLGLCSILSLIHMGSPTMNV